MADGPLVIAHRGLPKSAPENTLPSFAAALEHRPDFVECDYRHSADGVPIVLHDERLDRTTDAATIFGRKKLTVDQLRYDELARLDAGRWFAPQFAGTRLPTLEATIDTVCGRARLMIERKSGDAATLVELLRRKNVFDRIVVQSFDPDFLAECHGLEHRVRLGLLGEKTLSAERLARAAEVGATLVGWKHDDLTAAATAAAHRAGFEVWSWTLNEPARVRDLVAVGLDGVITDCCDAVRSWLAG